jgi:hypothetical protein
MCLDLAENIGVAGSYVAHLIFLRGHYPVQVLRSA